MIGAPTAWFLQVARNLGGRSRRAPHPFRRADRCGRWWGMLHV